MMVQEGQQDVLTHTAQHNGSLMVTKVKNLWAARQKRHRRGIGELYGRLERPHGKSVPPEQNALWEDPSQGLLFLQVHQLDSTLLIQAPGAGYTACMAVDGGPGMPCLKKAASTQWHNGCGAWYKDAGSAQPEHPILQGEWKIQFHGAHRAIQLETCMSSSVWPWVH